MEAYAGTGFCEAAPSVTSRTVLNPVPFNATTSFRANPLIPLLSTNVTIFGWLKRGQGRLLWLRAAIASVLSQIVDTLIFITVAFYGVFPIGQLVVGQMLAKVTLSIVLVPPLIYAFVALGRVS